MESLLQVFDRSKLIVAYNGRAFDMEVLKQYYNGDDGRWRAHEHKLRDPMEAVMRQAGRRVRMATLLKLNACGGKSGSGCDAPALWHDGKFEQLARYCRRDVDALRELVTRDVLVVPGGGTTGEAAILVGAEQPAPPIREAGVREAGVSTPRRPKRAVSPPARGYSDTAKRTRTRKTANVYNTWRGACTRASVGIKRGIEVGAKTIDRIVRGRYEWRDAGARPVTGVKRKLWEGNRTWDPGPW